MSDTSEDIPTWELRTLFVCAICKRDVVDYARRRGPDQNVAPLCRYCEGNYGERAPTGGAFKDRRLCKQIAALANALRGEAYSRQWRRDHGFA